MGKSFCKLIIVSVFAIVSFNSAAEDLSLKSMNGLVDKYTHFKSYQPSYFGIRIKDNVEKNEGEVKCQLNLKNQNTGLTG